VSTSPTLLTLSQQLGLSLEQQVLINHSISDLEDQFRGVFGRETVERYVLDSLTRLQGARVKQFIPLFTSRFAKERLSALARVEGRRFTEVPTVLFLCVHNAGRSQMAAAWLEHLSRGAVMVMTGGSDPASEINPAVAAAMAELGIDVSEQFPKPWTDEVVRAADVVVTMGCGDACPIYPGKRYEDWEVPDPSGLDVAAVRPIRDEIGRRVQALMASMALAA
jgi:protein-tyrosine-phosphatase